MVSTEADVTLMRLARRRYELARLRHALAGALPILVVGILAVALTARPFAAASFGGAAFIAGIGLLWYGRGPQRGVLPGLLAGVVPLALAFCASRVHACGPEGCSTYCVPACTMGGVVAGLTIAGLTWRRRERGVGFLAAASGLAILVGAMGCSCVGGGGVLGLVAGFAVGALPGIVRRLAIPSEPPASGE